MKTLAIALVSMVIASAGCNGTTGSGLVTFSARAGGPVDAAPNLAFDSGIGYHVTLTQAQLHVGAVYLNMTVPSSGGPDEPCILPGIYVGQAFGPCDASGVCGVDLDLLSPALHPFTASADGTANPALEAEVWLTSGDINATTDTTPVFVTAGTASNNGVDYPFAATVTIGQNRQLPTQNPAMPGANPICRQRIVSPIPVDITLTNGGTLDLRVDPRGMFDEVDFATLTAGSDGTFAIPDVAGGIGGAFFKGVTAIEQYAFAYSAGAP